MPPKYTPDQLTGLTLVTPDKRFLKPRMSVREANEKAKLEEIQSHTRRAAIGAITDTRRSVRVRGSRGRSSEPNKAEKAYIAILEARKVSGEIKNYWFESIKLRLADRTWFECDFMVLTGTGEMEMHEVKAIWKMKDGSLKVHREDDSNVKIKVVAELYPFRFVVAGYYKGEFTLTDV